MTEQPAPAVVATPIENSATAVANATAIEHADVVRTAAAAWTAAADSKAAAILAIGGAIFAIVLTGTASSKVEPWELLLVVLFSLTLVVSVAAAAFVLWPRTDRRQLLKDGGHASSLPRSRRYFGDIAAQTFAEFSKGAAEQDNSADDALEQAYVTAVIAAKKMGFMRIAVAALLASLVFLAVLVVVAAVTRL